MNVLTGPHDGWPRPAQPTAVAVGVFDGVHLGHLALLGALAETGAPVAVVTFDPHPLVVIAPDQAPRLLCPLSERIDRLAAAGVDTVAVVSFDHTIRQLSANDFVVDLLVGALRPATIAAGLDFRFGKDRVGDLALLESLGSSHGFRVLRVDLVGEGGGISSSRIRESLGAGEIVTAAEMLGRDFDVTGLVVRGEGRGATVGFPTANLALPPELMVPGRGVYAVRATVDGEMYDGVANIGVRPTFGDDEKVDVLEVHLLDRSLDLYDKTMSVAFVARLRAEQRFDGVEALRSQIAIDVDAARTALAARTP